MKITLDPPKEVVIPEQNRIYVVTEVSIGEKGNQTCQAHWFQMRPNGNTVRYTLSDTGTRQMLAKIIVGNFFLRNYGKEGLF